MAEPRKKWPQFTSADKKIPLGLWNDLLRTVEGLDTGSPTEGYASQVVKAPYPPGQTILRLVELDDAIGPDESSEFRDRRGTVLYWDSSNSTWKRTDPAHQVSVITDGFEHLVQDQGQRLVVWFHGQSGKYLPVNPNNMRQLRTCRDAGGSYPTKPDCPNVYPTEHVTSSYSLPSLGTFVVTPTHTAMTSIDRLTPEPPHGGKAGGDDVTGYVYNLAGGGDDEGYIPEGTVVPAWFLNGQWWTYWYGLAVCEHSSSMSTPSSSPSSPSTGGCTTTTRSSLSTSSTSSSPSTGYCTTSTLSCSSILRSSSSVSCTSSVPTSESSLDLWKINVVVDVCCDDDGSLVVVTKEMAFRYHHHSKGYVLIWIADRDPPDKCQD
jgi:hypothetical protein